MRKIFSTLLLLILLCKASYAQTHDFTKLLNTIIESDFSSLKTNLRGYGKFSKKNGVLNNQKYGITVYNVNADHNRIEIRPTNNLAAENTTLNFPIELRSILSTIPTKLNGRNYFPKIELLNEKESILKIIHTTGSLSINFQFKTDTTFFKSKEIVTRLRISNSFEEIKSLKLSILKIEVDKFNLKSKKVNIVDFNIEPRYDYKNQFVDSAEIFLLKRLKVVDHNTPAYWDVLYGLYDANMRKRDYVSAINYLEILLELTKGKYKKGYVKLIEAYTLSGNIEKSLATFQKYNTSIVDTESRFQANFYNIINLNLHNKTVDLFDLKEALIFRDDFPGFERHNPYMDIFLKLHMSSLNEEILQVIAKIKERKSFVHRFDLENSRITGLASEQVMIAVSPPFWISLHDEKKAIEVENIYYNSEVSIKPSFFRAKKSISEFILKNIDLPSSIKDSYAGLDFTVLKDGSIENIEIKSKLPTEYIEKIKNLLISTQPWSPAYKYIFPVDCRINESVYFPRK